MTALERPAGASSTRRPFAERLPRRRERAAWVVAVVAPALITLGSRLLSSSVPPATTLFVTLLVVVVAALLGGVRPALAAIVAGLVAQEVLFGFPYGSLSDRQPAQLSVLVVFVVIAAGIGVLVDELARLTTEQAALRRIATLVAHGTPSAELFSDVAHEVAGLLLADSALVAHLESDGAVAILAAGGARADEFTIGERWRVAPATATQPTDDFEQAASELGGRIRRMSIRSSVATPIVVDRRLWGLIVASSKRESLSSDAGQRMLDFTDLDATAIADAESRSQLAASRARIVAASDEARRRVERDLHDGVQQRLVSLALEVRAAQSALPSSVPDVRAELSHVVDG